MDYIYGNINNNLVTINRLEYVELRKCEIANQPIEGLNVGDFYLAFKVFDCKKLIYCNLAEMNQDIIDELNKKLAGKVDKIEKTNSWRVYGVGSKQLDLPNGDSIDVSDQSIPNTLINRNANGTAQINNPVDDKDIANKQYVDDNFERKTVLSNVLPTDNILLDLHNYQLESPITSDFSFIMPANASDEYLSEISFTTGPTLVAFTTTSAITFTGEDCSNTYTFVPDINKHYNIIFWKDKAGFQAVVRGY